MPIFIVDNNRGLMAPITLSKEDEHHLVRVMRVQIGEKILVTDNFGTRGDVEIETVKPLTLVLKIKNQMPRPKPIALALPLIDTERLEWAVEKLTELNCAKIILTATERTQKNTLADSKLARLKKIAESAQKQCGRCWPIEITGPVKLADVIKSQAENLFFVADLFSVGAETKPSTINTQPSTIFVGPEGGFTDAERKLFSEHEAHFKTLGDTVLRTETAAIAAYLDFSR